MKNMLLSEIKNEKLILLKFYVYAFYRLTDLPIDKIFTEQRLKVRGIYTGKIRVEGRENRVSP